MLNYAYFDKRLLAREAADVGLSEAEVVDAWEDNYKVGNLWERLFSREPRATTARTWRETPDGARVAVAAPVDFDQATQFVRQAIESAYTRGEIVIVGRGGQAVLSDRPGVLHVRLEAPNPVRVNRVAENDHVSAAHAQAIIEQKDRAAAEYLRRYHGVDWTNAALYHLIINTSKWDSDGAASLIADAAERLPT
jgi:cytidylate kinase